MQKYFNPQMLKNFYHDTKSKIYLLTFYEIVQRKVVHDY